ncbi:hypothetical protein [Aminobacter aminovorans]|nr:hypothetical protein [Aminobacter aminovorans]MBB3706145.1 hypothetical protein [Aminobacter aminovorans]
MVADISDLTVEQARLDSMLTRGIVFSIVWLAGFGSCYALYQGIRARRMLGENRRSRGMAAPSGAPWQEGLAP